MKNNAFTRFLKKHGLLPVDFIAKTGVNQNTVLFWCYNKFKPSPANKKLAEIVYSDFPKGEK